MSTPLEDLALAEAVLISGEQTTNGWQAVELIRQAVAKLTAQVPITTLAVRHDWNALR